MTAASQSSPLISRVITRTTCGVEMFRRAVAQGIAIRRRDTSALG